MARQQHRPSPIRSLVLVLACFSLLVLRHNGGSVMAQDTDGGGGGDNSNDNDDGGASLSPTGAPTSLDAASDYPDCTGYTSHIKDGYCDTDLNNADCGFDGGDCCACTCGSDDEDEELAHACGQVGDGFDCQDPDVPADCGATPSPAASYGYPDCTGYMYNFQNSYCNDDLNNAACGYDGGDCCRCTCRDYAGVTEYSWYNSGYTCGYYGFDCMDPEAPSSCSTDSPTPSPAAGTDYPECEGYIYKIGDGYCDSYDNNNEECGWDGGDCCACTCESTFSYTCGYYGYYCEDPDVASDCSTSSLSEDYPYCSGYTYKIGDGYCDYSNNNSNCGWDGGDCCACTCESTSSYTCGYYGYDCEDPDVSSDCSTSSLSDDYLSCYGSTSSIGDGDCDSSNNNEDCGWDGGDCCACTCESTSSYTCGYSGYDCEDPDVSSDCSTSSLSEDYPYCSGYTDKIGDGYCDYSNNNSNCGWDGGDCCACTCESTSSYTCGYYGYDCEDPDVSSDCSTSSLSEDYPYCSGYTDKIGDGYCDYSNNNFNCGWDGGDCCECDCVSSYYTCGYYTYNCLDPSSICYGSTSDGGGDDFDDRGVVELADESEPNLSSAEIGGAIVLSVFGFFLCGGAILVACGLLPSGWLSRRIRDASAGATSATAADHDAPDDAVNRPSDRAPQRPTAPVAEKGPPLAVILGTASAIPSNNANVTPADDIEQRTSVYEQTARFGGGIGVEESKGDNYEAALGRKFHRSDDGGGRGQAWVAGGARGGAADHTEEEYADTSEEEKGVRSTVAQDFDDESGGDSDDGGAIEGREKDVRPAVEQESDDCGVCGDGFDGGASEGGGEEPEELDVRPTVEQESDNDIDGDDDDDGGVVEEVDKGAEKTEISGDDDGADADGGGEVKSELADDEC